MSDPSGHDHHRRDNASPYHGIIICCHIRGRDNPKQNYIKYFFFYYATYATLPVPRVVTGFVKSASYAKYPATNMPNTYATTRLWIRNTPLTLTNGPVYARVMR